MSTVWIVVAVVAVIIILMALFIWSVYNALVRLNERVDEAWSDITIQLKYRADLIPNLLETVKGYAAHESEVFDKVSSARSEMISAGDNVKAAAQAENVMTEALGKLFAVAEAYPDLKANEGFVKFQQQQQEIEDKIQGARRFYNGGARDLNIKIKTFPTNVFARKLGFDKRDYFEVDNHEAIEKAPEVKF